jgi:UDP-glucose 4-epimerase
MMAKVLVTGASGFVGLHLMKRLKVAGHEVRGVARVARPACGVSAADILDERAMLLACEGMECLVHCAGYAHAMSRQGGTDAAEHWRTNFEGVRIAARAAEKMGVRRFVLVSSVKAAGDGGSTQVDESWDLEPDCDYGRAKRAAETFLQTELSRMEVVVIRLAMVYGPESRGNLERMLRLCEKGWFPPIPETGNRRSFVHVSDVADALLLAVEHPAAAGRLYIVCDKQAYSGRQLYNEMRSALGLSPVGMQVPRWLLSAAAQFGDTVGVVARWPVPLNSIVVDRLLESAWYSAARIEAELGWLPRVNLAAGLRSLLTSTNKV